MKNRGRTGVKRPFHAALMRLIDEGGPHPTWMEEIAKALLVRARAGDTAAIREIADRLDGRVPQAIVGSDEHAPLRVERIEREIIDPMPVITGDQVKVH